MLQKTFKADRLTVKIYDSRKAMGQAAAEDVAAKIKEIAKEKGEVNMIFASAPSQNEFLAGLLADKDIPWEKVNTFHMDEYIKLDKDAPQGFGNFIRDALWGKVNLKSANYLNGNAPDLAAECKRYTDLLKANPVDIVCMGIGENGHLAFNDPGIAKFGDTQAVKVVVLDEVCRQQQVNDGCFASLDLVPTHALSLTIPSLVDRGYLFCIVPAKTKARAVVETVKGYVTELIPASILRTKDKATLYLDPDSGYLL
jgi:glucosamine-6-phosphate deaminase